MAPRICSIHLGRNGLEYKTRDEAVAEFQVEIAKSLFDPFVVRDDKEIAERRAKQAEARQRLLDARFFDVRDASASSEDIQQDNDPARRRRRISLTRDMIRGPVREINVVDTRTGMRSIGDVGHDRTRFVTEVDRLRMMGIFDADECRIDWHSDESIASFFAKVYDKALEEAKNYSRTGVNLVIDNAPGIYLFTELLKRTERMVEEDFTQMWARSIFPIMNLNTWLPQWLYQRQDIRTTFPQLVDIERLPSGAPRAQQNRAAVPRPLVFWHHAASWSTLELARYAEAVATNGAASRSLDQERINVAIQMMNWFENNLAFFGDDDLDIHGLFSAEAKTGIERIASGGGFESGTTEQDRQLLTREVKLIRSNTEQALAPNTILLGTDAFDYVVDKPYGDVSNDSTMSVLERAEVSLRKFGVTDVLWVPEVGYSTKQEDRLLDHGVAAAEAQRLAGGIGDGNNTMVVMRRDPKVMEMVVAKDRVMFPARQTVNDQVEARMMQGGGGMVFYKPEAIKIVTDVGPNP